MRRRLPVCVDKLFSSGGRGTEGFSLGTTVKAHYVLQVRSFQLVLVFLGITSLAGAQSGATNSLQSLPALEVDGRTYSNVTLKSCDGNHVTVTHDAGIKNIRLDDLNLDQMKALNSTTTLAAIDLSKVDPNPPSPVVIKKVEGWIQQAGGVNRRLENGNTALIEAVLTGQTDYVKAALKKRADPNATNKDNHTAWYEAAVRGYTEIAEMLEKAGAKVPNLPGSVESGDLETVHLFLAKDPKAGESRDDAGRTLLMIAVRAGRDKVAEALIAKGAALDARDSEAKTALIHAAAAGKTDCVKLLLEKGADGDARDNNGTTPLIAATNADSLETVRVLLDRGVSLRAVDRQNGWNALMHAADKGKVDIARFLLERGARTDQTDRRDRTALAIARNSGNSMLIELIAQAQENAEKAKLEKQKSIKRVLGDELASQGEEQVRRESLPRYVPFLIWSGVIIAAIGHIWLTLVSIHDGVAWGLLVLFFNPLGGVLYTFGRGLGNIRGALPIFTIYLVGIALVWVPARVFEMNLFEFFL